MKKSIIVGMSILSIFILCSLSYQPIIADTPIENISQVKEFKTPNRNIDEIKELYNKLIKLKSQSNDDCGCEDTTVGFSPIICSALFIIFAVFIALFVILPGEGSFKYLVYALDIVDIANENNCLWVTIIP